MCPGQELDVMQQSQPIWQKKKSRKSLKTANFDHFWPFKDIFGYFQPFLAIIGLFSLFNMCPEQELDDMQQSLPIWPQKNTR